LWNPDPTDIDQVTSGLAFIAERIGRPAVLFPTDDVGSLYLAEHGSELRRWFLFPDPPADLPRRVADKYSLYHVCRELGLSAPQVCLPDSLEQALEFVAAVDYPVIAKLATPWLSGGRLPTTSMVRDKSGVTDLYHGCQKFGVPLMLQEYIPGGAGNDWFFHGYCDASSVCHPAFTGIKVRSFPLGAGGTTFGRSVANEKLREQVTELLRVLNYRGIMDLDIRLDPRDGQYNLLDFNPRVGAQFRLFRDTAGTDVVLAAYLDLTGQVIPPAAQLDDRTFMVESYDPLSVLAHRRRGDLTVRTWLTELRNVDEPAWFARDDLRPFGLMCARMTWKTASRALPRVRSKSTPKSSQRSGIQYRAGRTRLVRG
jgi:predicted ATP-grasp superfamily ATP-dependent carboligase